MFEDSIMFFLIITSDIDTNSQDLYDDAVMQRVLFAYFGNF